MMMISTKYLLFELQRKLMYKHYSWVRKHRKEKKRHNLLTFFPRITDPGSPWITIYFAPARYKPVGAREPGSLKSFIIPVISSGLNCIYTMAF